MEELHIATISRHPYETNAWIAACQIQELMALTGLEEVNEERIALEQDKQNFVRATDGNNQKVALGSP